MANFLVGCDIGTSGTKSVVMDEEGNILGSHYIEYPMITPRPGWAEHDPEWYWEAVADTIKVSIKQANIDAKEIRGVSISAMSPACILVDKNLRPLQNAHFWMDRRATAESDYIKDRIGEERVFQVSANPVDPYYGIVKFLWEKNNNPDLYKQTYKVLNSADYPVMKLTGKALTDYSNASLMGIAYDIVKKKWDTDILEELELDPSKLPEAFPCDEVIGEVCSEAADRTGLYKGTPVVAGTVDCNAAWVANGAIHEGDMSLAMGTAGVLGVVHKEPKFTKNMITIVHTSQSKEMYTTLGATCSCGAVTRYYRDTFGQLEKEAATKLGIDVYELMNMSAAEVPVGSDGLLVLPYFMGERTPIWDPLARGVILGMSLSHGKAHLLRALIEGATYAIYDNFKFMKETGLKMNLPLILTEGGARSALWRQIVSDVLNIPVSYMKTSKGAPVGNAIAAGVGTGVFKDYSVVEPWVNISDTHSPNPVTNNTYMAYYDIFKDAYSQMKGSFENLAKVSGYK